jgi:hypothetical protein
MRDLEMIDSNHKIEGIVNHLMRYYHEREVCQLSFPPLDDKLKTPELLGFKKWWMPLTGMVEDWYKDTQLTGEQSCDFHICKDEKNKWLAYISSYNWKYHPLKISWDNIALIYIVSILKRLATLIDAKHCFLIWDWDEKHTGYFKGEALLYEYDNNDYKNENGRLARCFVKDRSFRIAWYSDKIAQKLYQSLDSGNITLIDVYSKGYNKLKDHMEISAKIPEMNISFTDIIENWDYRE